MTLEKHIVLDESGVAWLENTRHKVIEIAMDHVAHGWDADEIHRQHPELSLAQIHSALAFYYDNESEMEERISDSLDFSRELEARNTFSPMLARLRAAKLMK
jgi:uncharacterized protein (DUF433 family)